MWNLFWAKWTVHVWIYIYHNYICRRVYYMTKWHGCEWAVLPRRRPTFPLNRLHNQMCFLNLFHPHRFGYTLWIDSLDVPYLVSVHAGDVFRPGYFTSVVTYNYLTLSIAFRYDIDFINCEDQMEMQERNKILYESYCNLVSMHVRIYRIYLHAFVLTPCIIL